MKKLNLLSRAEMKKVMGGVNALPVDDGEAPCKTNCTSWDSKSSTMATGTYTTGTAMMAGKIVTTCDCSLGGSC